MFIEPILIVAMILTFMLSFWTGFTDAAYATAGIIATRAVKTNQAIALSALGSFIGMVFFGSAVAKTIGTGIITEGFASGEVIIAALLGSLIFDVLFSWVWALPISETHVLVGGLIGGGAAAGGFEIIEVGGNSQQDHNSIDNLPIHCNSNSVYYHNNNSKNFHKSTCNTNKQKVQTFANSVNFSILNYRRNQ